MMLGGTQPELSFEFVVEGILLFIVGVIGIFANIIAMMKFMEKGRHTFYRYILQDACQS